MKIIKTKIDGVYEVDTIRHQDNRGGFVKTFCTKEFKKFNLISEFKESYYSISRKGVIRGMHFQLPPHDIAKLVYVTNGSVEDVVIDLRKDSKTYGEYIEVHLSAEINKCLYIQFGCGHGFKSLEDNTVMTYLQSDSFSPECDSGISYSSIGKDWNDSKSIISERDLNLIDLANFESPFLLGQA